MKDIFYGFIRDIKTLRLVWSTSGFTDYTQEVLGYFRQLGKLLGFSVRAEKKRYDLSWYRETEKIPFLHIEHIRGFLRISEEFGSSSRISLILISRPAEWRVIYRFTDPQNLKIGDQIFHVPTQSWVKVLNFKSKTGHFKVYDVVTDPLNVFVGNGILLDVKMM